MGMLEDIKDWLNLEKRTSAGMEREPGVTRLFFATDIHGSSVCWRKFINAADFYDANVLVLGGDTTGKAIFPIVDLGDRYWYTRDGSEYELADVEALEEFKDTMANRGYYPYVFSQDEYDRHREEELRDRKNEIFRRQMIERIEAWCDFARERLTGDVDVYVCPGNDDPFEIDPVWAACDAVRLTEGEVVRIDETWEMASTGWTNRSPWDTDREEDEEALRRRIEGILQEVTDFDRCIFNFHDPPYGSRLDEAPELDEDLRPKFGGQTSEPVGSTAVREIIEKYQPPLSLHGHIHESRGKVSLGDTIAINPGSVYTEGSLQGAVIDLEPDVRVVGLVRG